MTTASLIHFFKGSTYNITSYTFIPLFIYPVSAGKYRLILEATTTGKGAIAYCYDTKAKSLPLGPGGAQKGGRKIAERRGIISGRLHFMSDFNCDSPGTLVTKVRTKSLSSPVILQDLNLHIYDLEGKPVAPNSNKCNCDIKILMYSGCQCGGE